MQIRIVLFEAIGIIMYYSVNRHFSDENSVKNNIFTQRQFITNRVEKLGLCGYWELCL